MSTAQRAAFELLTSGPAVVGLAGVPDLLAVVQDFAGVVDVEGVLDGLDADDCRAWAALVFFLMITSDDPAGVLRERAELVLTPEGRGPVHDQTEFGRALQRTAALLEVRQTS